MCEKEALNRFIELIGEINERLAELQEYMNNHMDSSPEEVHWGHVGSASHFLEKLTELTDMAYQRGEFAEDAKPPKKNLKHDQDGWPYLPVDNFNQLVQSARDFAKKREITPERLKMWPTSFFEDWMAEIHEKGIFYSGGYSTLGEAWRIGVDPNFS